MPRPWLEHAGRRAQLKRGIASAGLDGPSGEVVAVGLDQQVGVEFRRKERSVHGLVLAFVFVVILFFDLCGLSFKLSGLSFCTHPKM